MFTMIENYITFKFETLPSLFSPNAIDKGTQAMLSQVDFCGEEKILDMGCGYGIVGILAASEVGEENVTMCDISNEAVEMASYNAKLNGFNKIRIIQSDAYEKIKDLDFDLILCNPPYHTDFSVARKIIEVGYDKLVWGGQMILVVKRRLWYEKKMTSVFGGVAVKEIDGYCVMIAQKRRKKAGAHKVKAAGVSKKISRKIKARKNKMRNKRAKNKS